MKELSKINQEIFDLNVRVQEIENYEVNGDFNTRGMDYYNNSHIVANIRHYAWLDKDDVQDILEKQGFSESENLVFEEFDENRLSSILQHTCEVEINHAKGMYEECIDISNYKARVRAYNSWLQDKRKKLPKSLQMYKELCIKEWKLFTKRKKNSHINYSNWLYKNNKWEIDERERRESINMEVLQLGRSGGWLSVCNKDVVENLEFDYYFDFTGLNNKEFNECVNNELSGYISKQELINEMKSFIAEFDKNLETIQYYIDEIETMVKSFKEALISQLEFEVLEFLENIDRNTSNVTIKIKGDKVRTSMGVSVPKEVFSEAFKRISFGFKVLINPGDQFLIKENIGGYFVEFAKKIENDILIKAGCHYFSYNELKVVF